MKNNLIKYYIILYLTILFTYISSFTVYAHPGSLDSNGGHYNRSTGEYHYHSGEHTEYTSGSSSKKYQYEDFEEAYKDGYNKGYDDAYIDIPTESDDSEEESSSDLPLIIFGGIIFSCLSLYLLIHSLQSITNNLPKSLLSEYEKELEKSLQEKKAKTDILETISKNISDTKDLTLFKLVPDEYEIGDDGLPKEKGADGWGDSLTVYMSRQNGRKIHKIPNCQPIGNKKPIHLYWAQKLYPRSDFCLLCWKTHPHLEWFHEYMSVTNLEHEVSLFKNVVNEECSRISHAPVIHTENLICIHNKCNHGFRHFLIKLNKRNREKLNSLNDQYENTKLKGVGKI